MNKQDEVKKKNMSNATAGAVGAVLGGMVGAAAGVALSDKDKRKVVMQKLDQLKKYISSSLDEIAEISQETTDIIPEQVSLPKPKARARKKRAN